MKYLLLLVVLIIAESALADCPPKKEECPPKPKVVTVYKTQIQKQEVPKVETQAETKALSEAVADAEAQATTGNQTITINMPQPVKVLKRTITKKVTKIKKVKVLVYKPNRLQLFLGLTKTKLEIEQTCCMYSATRKYQPDVGLQYLRDFGSFTGSLAVTKNESIYLGLGFNW